MSRQKLLILTGPTAVGKTKLSLALANSLGGEILSADSMQVYRGMNIGTDKILPEQRAGIPHHLINIMDPREDFNVFRFQELALQAIDEITARGHLPIMVGGTGFYIQSVLYRIDFTKESDDGSYRQDLERRAGEEGAAALHAELASVDPDAAAAIHPNNVKRVIRALEYHHFTGGRISAHNETQHARDAAFDALYFVLTDDRQKLYERIDRRVDQMIGEGLEREVRGLMAEGLTGKEVSMQGLGYRQMVPYIRGEISLEEAVYRIKLETRHFAKRQLTWFKRERDVRYIDRREYPSDEDALQAILDIAEPWYKLHDDTSV
ncbi:MAG: tRNA (adenosine(37)-N6)-dimethylallyltransferase MiaA [Lachnospiraceae bacterium]|nr:tRNA (adenosine(37)-N6)-dimethylallyltransferase MiaA [Lachnospiraceae bacterium]